MQKPNFILQILYGKLELLDVQIFLVNLTLQDQEIFVFGGHNIL